jgi:hypothetical protein
MKGKRYTLKERIIMYLDVWILWILNAISDFVWFIYYLILSFLPFLWKVDTIQYKKPLPVLDWLACKMNNLCIDWLHKVWERRAKMTREELVKSKTRLRNSLP